MRLRVRTEDASACYFPINSELFEQFTSFIFPFDRLLSHRGKIKILVKFPKKSKIFEFFENAFSSADLFSWYFLINVEQTESFVPLPSAKK